MTQPRKVRPVRMNDEEVNDVIEKAASWGLDADFSAAMRFAARKLRKHRTDEKA